MKKLYIPFLTALLLGILFPPAALQAQVQIEEAWTLNEALDMPESVVYNPEEEVFYITNIVGEVSAKDGNGYITKVAHDGSLVEAKWVDNLDAPKGIAFYEGTIYVADNDVVVEIDAEEGAVTERYPAEGAEFLNDVTVDEEGNVYISDSGTNGVYRLVNGQLELWLQGDQIKAPNGVFAEEDYLIVAACTFDVEDAGSKRHFQYVSYDGKEIEIPQNNSPMGNIDGIKPDGNGGYFITEWGPGTLSHYSPEQGVTQLSEMGQGAADNEYVIDDQLLVVPVMMSDKLVAFKVQ